MGEEFYGLVAIYLRAAVQAITKPGAVYVSETSGSLVADEDLVICL